MDIATSEPLWISDAAQPGGSIKLRMLIASDLQSTRFIVTTILETLGHEVATVASADALIDHLATRSVDGVVIDCRILDIPVDDLIALARGMAAGSNQAAFATLNSHAPTAQLPTNADYSLDAPITTRKIFAFLDKAHERKARTSRTPLRLVQANDNTLPIIDWAVLDGELESGIGRSNMLDMAGSMQRDLHMLAARVAQAESPIDMPSLLKHANALHGLAMNLGAAALAACCATYLARAAMGTEIHSSIFRADVAWHVQKIDEIYPYLLERIGSHAI